MEIKKNNSYILWLPSWYPNKLKPFDGDFIQRHARAAALYNHIHVIYAVPDEEGMVTHGVIESFTTKERLTEHIIYFKKSVTLFGRMHAFLKWIRHLKKAVKQCIKENGKPGIVHVHVAMKAGVIARWLKRKTGVPYIVTEHSTHYSMSSDDHFFKRNIVYRKSAAKIFKGATAVTNVSTFMTGIIRKLFNLEQVSVIYNTVDTNLFNRKPVNNPKFRFIHVSTLTESQKNIRGILHAVRDLLKSREDFELVIVGPANAELKDLTVKLKLEKFILFTGEISYADVAKQMQRASALVLFSRYENFPCVIIEALCCGLPVISSDVGGIKEVVGRNNGMLVQAGNEPEMAREMNRMINEYQNFNKDQIARDAREKFSYSVIGKQFHELYSKLIR